MIRPLPRSDALKILPRINIHKYASNYNRSLTLVYHCLTCCQAKKDEQLLWKQGIQWLPWQLTGRRGRPASMCVGPCSWYRNGLGMVGVNVRLVVKVELARWLSVATASVVILHHWRSLVSLTRIQMLADCHVLGAPPLGRDRRRSLCRRAGVPNGGGRLVLQVGQRFRWRLDRQQTEKEREISTHTDCLGKLST